MCHFGIWRHPIHYLSCTIMMSPIILIMPLWRHQIILIVPLWRHANIWIVPLWRHQIICIVPLWRHIIILIVPLWRHSITSIVPFRHHTICPFLRLCVSVRRCARIRSPSGLDWNLWTSEVSSGLMDRVYQKFLCYNENNCNSEKVLDN